VKREGCERRPPGLSRPRSGRREPTRAVRRTEAERSPQQPDPSPARRAGWSGRPGKNGAGVGARPEQEEKTLHEDGMLKVPHGPGIGVTPVEAAIKEDRMPGEPYWD